MPARGASYDEIDLIRNGGDDDVTLLNRAVEAGSSMEFTPEWSPESGLSADRLAYCSYEFFMIDWDRPNELHYGWEQPPSDPASVWLGFANRDDDRWDWRRGNAVQMVTLGSFDPHIGGGSESMRVLVVLACDETCRLRWIRVGPLQVSADLDVFPQTALAPAEVMAGAGDSHAGVGSIESFEWDWDGDGVYEEDTGTDPLNSHAFSEVGAQQVNLRVTSSYGVQATDSAEVTIVGPWTHSAGGADLEEIHDVAAGGDSIYAVGYTASHSEGLDDALVQKYDLEGNLQWARAWGGEFADGATGVAIHVSDEVRAWVCGYTGNYGAGDLDGFLQYWDSDGTLLWTTTWGTGEAERFNAVVATPEGVYAAGSLEHEGFGAKDVLLVRFTESGEAVWGRTWGCSGGGSEEATDVAGWYDYFGGTQHVYLTGLTNDAGNNGPDLIYMEFSSTGTHLANLVLDGLAASAGYAITTKGALGNAIMGGTLYHDGSVQALLMEMGEVSYVFRVWGGSGEDSVRDVLWTGDSYLLCGEANSFSENPAGFLLQLSAEAAVEGSVLWECGESSPLNGMCLLPGGGVALGGAGVAADSGSWSQVTGALATPETYLSPLLGAAVEITGTSASPAGVVTEITDATIDTGGGSAIDAVVAIQPYP